MKYQGIYSNKLDVVDGWQEVQPRPSAEETANEKWHGDIVSWLKQQHNDFELEEQKHPEEGAFQWSIESYSVKVQK